MSELADWVARCYDAEAKAGKWDSVLSEWEQFPVIAKRCSRYQKPTSGWTFLHQAAYFGEERVCRILVRLGASIGAQSSVGETASEVARKKGWTTLASWLERATPDPEGFWVPSADPDILPSSCSWSEAVKCRASESMLVSYAGSFVCIPCGQHYYEDSLGRVLVGWHGSYDPPCGMDDNPMI